LKVYHNLTDFRSLSSNLWHIRSKVECHQGLEEYHDEINMTWHDSFSSLRRQTIGLDTEKREDMSSVTYDSGECSSPSNPSDILLNHDIIPVPVQESDIEQPVIRRSVSFRLSK
jgi:hypothetical protein